VIGKTSKLQLMVSISEQNRINELSDPVSI